MSSDISNQEKLARVEEVIDEVNEKDYFKTNFK